MWSILEVSGGLQQWDSTIQWTRTNAPSTGLQAAISPGWNLYRLLCLFLTYLLSNPWNKVTVCLSVCLLSVSVSQQFPFGINNVFCIMLCYHPNLHLAVGYSFKNINDKCYSLPVVPLLSAPDTPFLNIQQEFHAPSCIKLLNLCWNNSANSSRPFCVGNQLQVFTYWQKAVGKPEFYTGKGLICIAPHHYWPF